ncbi:YbaN family protein [Novosphingobium soli]|uniref:YbaN family protein n=1 Tax=Novosphingobium soli TaxID=574956 RepID=A0ABV6CZS9_9SPHN
MRRISRPLWIAGGLFFVGLGTLGMFVPLLPTVVFYLLAAWCFSKSHPEWAERLYAHPRYGPHLVAWRDRGAVSRKGKVAATAMMALSVGVVALTVGGWWTLIPVAVLASVGTWIWTRPE